MRTDLELVDLEINKLRKIVTELCKCVELDKDHLPCDYWHCPYRFEVEKCDELSFEDCWKLFIKNP
jgi:hypothetical protein